MNTSPKQAAQQESTEGTFPTAEQSENIYKTFVDSLELPDTISNNRQFLLCPVGLIGTGKTTTLKKITEHIPCVRIRTDDIRHIRIQQGYNLVGTRDMAFRAVQECLSLGHSVAIDADCVGSENKKYVDNLLHTFPNVVPIWIHIYADDSIVRKRLSESNTSRNYTGPRALARYEARKILHQQIDVDFDAEIDTGAADADVQLETLLKNIQQLTSS